MAGETTRSAPSTAYLPGANHSPFLLAHPGFYVWEAIGDEDISCVHLIFRGNDLHSGTEPTAPLLTPEQHAEIDWLIQFSGPQNRVAYINYPPPAWGSEDGGGGFEERGDDTDYHEVEMTTEEGRARVEEHGDDMGCYEVEVIVGEEVKVCSIIIPLLYTVQ